ncbi:MAG: ATP-binding cassette domain-containing protein [Deltaproteobacteria bacterium]|nr:ATP-binding cassette domain-containing protein [Deltaproteobacteria bacterium]
MITVKDITCRLGSFHLQPTSLELHEGDYWILLGPTGSGKSVLLSIIAGLIRPDSGRVLKEGADITHVVPERRGFSMMVQDFALFPNMSVFENIAFPLRVRHQPKKEVQKRVEAMAAQMGIKYLLQRSLRGLSGGEKQRIALARALVVKPDLLLLDEPLSALDQMTKRELIEELRGIHREYGIPVLHVTHDFEEGISLGNRMAVIHQGEIVQRGTPEELSQHPRSPLVAAFIGMKNIFKGTIEFRENTPHFVKGEVCFELPTGRPGEGTVAIPSEDIVLSKAPVESSARNILTGEVREIRPRPPLTDVLLDVKSLPFTATVTSKTVKKMGIQPGMHLFATFKVASVKVF